MKLNKQNEEMVRAFVKRESMDYSPNKDEE